MSMIYHITTREDWQQAQQQGTYTAPSLADEGFIHCSTLSQITQVANAFYSGQTNLLLLAINSVRLTAPLKWEAPAHPADKAAANDTNHAALPDDSDLFPHVYGAINLKAVERVLDFPPDADGHFRLPPAIHP
jgi:uncharacterized protein (DUF952 family)